jgi:ABC-type transport system involved in multi-copper enzyme maturation permease subunit
MTAPAQPLATSEGDVSTAAAPVFVRGRPGPGVVVERELLRSSRRWQTAGLRVAYAAVMLCFIAFLWKERVLNPLDFDPSALSWAGRRVFQGYTLVQTWMLVLLTPILVAQGIIEERNAGTLSLLAITHLSPRDLLLGKLASRLLVVEAVLLAGLPFLGLCLSLGGVGPTEVLNVFLQANAMMLGLAAVSCFVSLYARGPILPALAAWGWAFLAWVPGGGPMAVWRGDEDDMSWVSPLVALLEGEGIAVVGPLIAAVVVAAFATALSAGVFSTLAGDDADGEHLSVDVWAVERMGRRLGLLVAALFVALAPLAILWAFSHRSSAVGDWVAFPAIWAWNVLALVAGTGLYLFAVRRVVRWLGARRERRIGWKAELVGWEGEPAGGLDRARSLSQHGPGEGPRKRVHAPRLLRPVWANPVAWREVVTSIHGGIGRFLGWGQAAAAAFLLLLCLVPDFLGDPGGLLACSFLALGAAWLATALATASSASGELRARSLSLLVTSRLSPSAIVGGKLAGVLAVAGPPLAIAIALLLGGVGQFSTAYRWGWDDGLFDPRALLLRWAAMSAFAIAVTAWFATSGLWLGLRARTPGRAWVACLVHVAAWVVLPAILRLLVDGDSGLEAAVAWINPALNEDFWQREAVPTTIWASSAGWLALSALAFARTAATLGRRASG